MKLLGMILLFCVTVSAEYRSYFSPFDDLDKVAQDEINSAKKSIDIAIYTFRSKPIRQRLIEAMNRGVKVRLLIRPSNKQSTIEFAQPMYDAGAAVRFVRVTNHHKYAIIDGEVLLNSSGNFNDSRLQKSYDENLFVCDTCDNMVDLFQEEFDFLFEYSNKLIGDNDVSQSSFKAPTRVFKDMLDGLFTSFNFNPFFNKRTKSVSFRKKKNNSGFVVDRIVKDIDRARSSVKVATGHFRSYRLFDALVRANKRGVKVEVIFDGQEYITSYWQNVENERVAKCMNEGGDILKCTRTRTHFARKAFKQGIDVAFKYYALIWAFLRAPQMHHKYMIIDDRVVYAGSYNWSNNAEFNTLENVSIVRDRRLVSDYLQNFKKIRSYGKGTYKALKQSMQQATKKLPINFSPVSLSVPQIDALREIACQKCPQVFCNSSLPPNAERSRVPKACDVR